MIHNPVTRWLFDDSVTPYLYSSRNRSYTLNEKLILTSPWRKERKWGKLYSMKSYWKRVNKAFTPRRGVKGVRWVKNEKYSGVIPIPLPSRCNQASQPRLTIQSSSTRLTSSCRRASKMSDSVTDACSRRSQRSTSRDGWTVLEEKII